MFVQSFKILGQIVPVKSLTEKLTDRNPYRKSKNYIYVVYSVYQGHN